MKFLLLVVLLLAAFWIWNNGRRRPDDSATPKQGANRSAPAQDMVACEICSVHLPRSDAVTGGDGRLYCSAEHRLRGGS